MYLQKCTHPSQDKNSLQGTWHSTHMDLTSELTVKPQDFTASIL